MTPIERELVWMGAQRVNNPMKGDLCVNGKTKTGQDNSLIGTYARDDAPLLCLHSYADGSRDLLVSFVTAEGTEKVQAVFYRMNGWRFIQWALQAGYALNSALLAD